MGSVEAVAAASGGEWEFYRDERGIPVVKLEIHNGGDTPHERAMVLAEVGDLLRAAVRGDLKPYLDIAHIVRNPLIYELRWKLGDEYTPTKLWRLYFGWHSNRGPLRIALKFGSKPHGEVGLIVQNGHIDEASARYKLWLKRPQPGSIT
ncbi:hypothetical protein [Amycolatopsis sp. EV170708-02-1]|uniref:hypothetical protein n=1 Tax=Amycolatopsis sp. EV170708-02-1 TaxID=2919322 RepID=UPI001F0BEBB4|nr:hypothetical protein [Amycolatopsis sp. EV170708-02-1]UMP02238.1 hypothetical protein MJQ72_38565 [Amycolatopsis sp. EV170708-02-1]